MELTAKQSKCVERACKELWDIDNRICYLVESGLFDEDFDLDDLEDLVATVGELDYQDFC